MNSIFNRFVRPSGYFHNGIIREAKIESRSIHHYRKHIQSTSSHALQRHTFSRSNLKTAHAMYCPQKGWSNNGLESYTQRWGGTENRWDFGLFWRRILWLYKLRLHRRDNNLSINVIYFICQIQLLSETNIPSSRKVWIVGSIIFCISSSLFQLII